MGDSVAPVAAWSGVNIASFDRCRSGFWKAAIDGVPGDAQAGAGAEMRPTDCKQLC